MSLILSGTNGLSDVDGSAATPAIRGTDTNTGIFFPAADTVGISTGGTERARVDSAGNMGLGVTPSAWGSGYKALQINNGGLVTNTGGTFTGVIANAYFDGTNYKYTSTAAASLYRQNAGAHDWNIAGSGTAGANITFTQAMTLDASGNLGVGITSIPAYSTNFRTVSFNNTNGVVHDYCVNGTRTGSLVCQSTGFDLTTQTAIPLVLSTNSTERARIDSSGPLLIGLTSVFNGTTCPLQVANNAANQTFTIRNTNATPYGQYINFGGASPNNTANEFLYCSDTTAQRFTARSNGGLANYSGNNVNLSDRREKTNFAPAKSYLETICAIPVQTFNYIDQNMEEDPGLTLGVVAQDVQAVAPELVMESNWAGKDEEPKMRLSIYQTDLQYALMKCIQEQQAIITQLQADVAALKGNA